MPNESSSLLRLELRVDDEIAVFLLLIVERLVCDIFALKWFAIGDRNHHEDVVFGLYMVVKLEFKIPLGFVPVFLFKDIGKFDQDYS